MPSLFQTAKNFVLKPLIKMLPAKAGRVFGRGFSSDRMIDPNGYRISLDVLFSIYNNQSDVASAIGVWQQNVGSNGYRFYNPKDRDAEVPKSITNELHEIFNYTAPWRETRGLVVRDLGSAGNGYLHILMSASQRVVLGLNHLDPRTMRVVATSSGRIIKYIQKTVGNDPVEFDPWEIIHFKRGKSTKNELFGMSPIEQMLWEARTDMAAMLSNYFFFENDATPATVYILEDGLSEEEQKVASDLIKTNFKGVKNRHKAMVMAGIKEVKQLSMSAKDMEYYQGRKFATDKICAAFGVPKFMLGYTDSVNNNNGIELTKNAYNGTFNPLERLIDDTLNRHFIKVIGLGDKAAIEHIPQVFDKAEAEKRGLEELRAGVITPRQYKLKTGQEITPEDEANPMFDTHIIHSGASAVLLEDAGVDPVVDPNDPETARNMIKVLKQFENEQPV